MTDKATGNTSFFAPLRHSHFRNFWIANVVSNFGGLIQGVGAAWLMTSITSSETMVALVQASTALPIMAFSLAAGAIADNFDRRKVMLLAQAFMLGVSALLTLTEFLGWVTPWVLLVFTFLIGCGTALNNPSWQASVGDLVPRSDIAGAVSLNSISFNVVRSVGPAAGGALVAFGGAVMSFAANTASYVPLISVLLRWKKAATATPLPREAFARSLVDGIRYVSMSPNLMRLFTRGFMFGVSAVALPALLPLIARHTLGGGPVTYGVLLGGFGIGAVMGAMFNAPLRQRLPNEMIVRLAFLSFAISQLIIGMSGKVAVVALASALAGACWAIALSLFNTIVQLSTPRWVVGRAISFHQTATFGGMAVGGWIWGQIAERQSIEHALLIAAATMVLGAVAGLALPMPPSQSLDLDPLDSFREPALQLDVRPRSGPIAIQVHYEIRDEDLPEFLKAMTERRRIRIRDGAKSWALMRDLESPKLWIETYHTPTWVDYVRHNKRRTKADAESQARLRALHQGDRPPRVQRLIERQTIPTDDDIFHQSETGVQ
jgi:MFS family permease